MTSRRLALVAAIGLCLAVGCGEPFPPGWLYVTRVDETAATIVWTGEASAAATCRGRDGRSVTAPGEEWRRGLVTARVESLVPNTRYTCRVRSPGGGVLHRLRFRTAPSSTDQPFLFAVVGDSGHGGPVTESIARRINAAHPAFLIHTGDLAYTHGIVRQVDRRLFVPFAQTLSRMAFYPTPGNHDLYSRSIYRDLFAPVTDWAGRNTYRYHFTWGPASLASMSAPEAADGPTDFVRDFDADRPWRIVFLHEPLFTAGSKRVEAGLRATFGPVVEEAGVDLVIAGHQHFYERSEPSCAYSKDARVTHVTSGGGSAQRFLDPAVRHPNFPVSVSAPHFLRVRVTRDQIAVRAVGADGRTLDRFRRRRDVDPGCRSQGWPRQHPRG